MRGGSRTMANIYPISKILYKSELFDSATPEVSVIIIDYVRHNFTKESLLSVINQNIAPTEYEIILLTDDNSQSFEFVPSEISLIVIYTDTINIGLSYYLGLLHSKAKIICPLDNDDLWVPNRLKKLIELFKEDEKLIFIKNEITPFRDHQNFLLRVVYIFTMNIHLAHRSALYLIDRKFCTSYIGRSLLHNSSSMSFHKRIFSQSDSLDKLKEVIALADPFFFFSALAIEGKIGYYDSPLTMYRVGSNLGPNDFKTKFKDKYKMRYQFDQINEIFKDKLTNSTEGGSKIIFEIFCISMKIELNLKAHETNKLSVKEILGLMRYAFCLKSTNLMLLTLAYLVNKYIISIRNNR